MYTFLTLFGISFSLSVLWLVFSTYYGSGTYYSSVEKIFRLLGGVLGFFIISFILSFIIGVIIAWAIPSKQELKIEKTTIECLNDGSSVNGQFFLGCGSVNGNMVYSYYVKKGEFFTLKQVDATSSQITYLKDKTTKPYLVIQKMIDIPADRCSRNNWCFDRDEEISTIFYIPEGSIKSNYNLDAQ